MVEKGIYELLTADPGVSALVGKNVYWVLQPKGTGVPSIVLLITDTKDQYVAAGTTGNRVALVQLDCYATDYYSSRAVSRAARLLLEDYTGNLPDADATPVTAVFIEKDWDMGFEPGQKGFVYRALLEAHIHYSDTSNLPINTPASGGEAVIDGGTSTSDDTHV